MGFLGLLTLGMLKNYDKTLKMIRLLKIRWFNLGCSLAYALGDYLAPVLVAAYTLNNVDRGDRQDHENEDYESEGP